VAPVKTRIPLVDVLETWNGAIPENVAFFAGTIKASATPGTGVAPFQVSHTSTSGIVVFTGAPFNLRDQGDQLMAEAASAFDAST